MTIDYSLYGGAESPFPPSDSTTAPPLPTPGLTADEDCSSGSSDTDDTGLATPTDSEAKKQLGAGLGSSLKQRKGAASSRSTLQIGKPVPASSSEDPQDFLWIMTEEPHRSRRKAILKAHPEVRKLMGHTRATAPLVGLVLAIQLTTALCLRNTHPLSLKFLFFAYAIGGTCNQNIFLAIHEITHNLAFKKILPNKLLAMVANLAIGVPYAMAFKGYHIEHHKFLGEDGIDTDLPSKFEAIVLNNVAGKTFFATFQILFYALRPGFIRSQKPTWYHLLNAVFILAADFLLVKSAGWAPLLYLLFSSFFAGSLHPCAAHFIAEHYLMSEVASEVEAVDPQGHETELEHVRALSQETSSYYGWLNILCYNVGYHNEHHDFPSVPWTRLPQLREMAKEFYDPLPVHKSWPIVTWKFISDPRVGMWSRAKRQAGEKGERIDESAWKACERAVDVDVDGSRKSTKSSSSSGDPVVILKNGEEDAAMDRLMSEAVERGYGSDAE